MKKLAFGGTSRTRTLDSAVMSRLRYQLRQCTEWLGVMDLNHRIRESKSRALTASQTPIKERL